jgi:hypothetical protein
MSSMEVAAAINMPKSVGLKTRLVIISASHPEIVLLSLITPEGRESCGDKRSAMQRRRGMGRGREIEDQRIYRL